MGSAREQYPRRPKKAVLTKQRGPGEAWFYIDDDGLDVYTHVSGSGVVGQARLSWRQVEAAVRIYREACRG